MEHCTKKISISLKSSQPCFQVGKRRHADLLMREVYPKELLLVAKHRTLKLLKII